MEVVGRNIYLDERVQVGDFISYKTHPYVLLGINLMSKRRDVLLSIWRLPVINLAVL